MEMSVRAQSSERLIGAGGSTSKLTHVTVSRKPQCLTTLASPQGCSSVLTTWQLVSIRVNDPGDSNKEVTLPVMTKSYTANSATCYLLEVSHQVQPTLKGKGSRLHLLEGGVLKNLWHFQITTVVILDKHKIHWDNFREKRFIFTIGLLLGN